MSFAGVAIAKIRRNMESGLKAAFTGVQINW
jgi:hypothetical protein